MTTKTRQNRTGKDMARQGNANKKIGKERTEQSSTGHMTRQGRAGHGMVGYGRVG